VLNLKVPKGSVKPRWTAAELAIVREHYAAEGARRLRERLPQRSFDAITRAAKKLGVRSGVVNEPSSRGGKVLSFMPWSDRELASLAKHYRKGGLALAIRKLPGRSADAIVGRARQLRLRREKP
jgi:hypothetical protein